MSKVSRKPQRTHTSPVTVPAPTKGLNTIDPLGAMDPQYALVCKNFVAAPQGLAVRKGYKQWTPGYDIKTLIPYSNTVTSALFAIGGGGNIIDATTIGIPSVVGNTFSTNDYWQWATQGSSTAGNNYLFLVNGEAAPVFYDGAGWNICIQDPSPSLPGVFKDLDANGNPVDIMTFMNVMLHKQRLWFVAKNSTTAYYLDIAAVGGELNPFDFGPLFPRGGTLHKIASWTSDVGGNSGTQSVLVAISSLGDVVIYAGDNPSDATNWSLVGQYQLGAPVGMNCTAQLEGDLLYLSKDGLYPLSKYMATSRGNTTVALTYAIASTIADLVATYGELEGFSLTVQPTTSLLILNVPQPDAASNFQFVFNTITRGWTQFTGWPASCFCVFADTLYFGTADGVQIGFYGFTDAADMDGLNGSSYNATALQAYNHFNEFQGLGYGVIKQAVAVKPYIITGDTLPSLRVGVNTDYNLVPTTGVSGTTVLSGGVWDGSNWDEAGATWGGSLGTYNQWSTPLCWPGEALALSVSVSVGAETMWVSTSWLIEPGGQFG